MSGSGPLFYGGPQVSRQKLLKTTQTLSFTRPVSITAKVDGNITAKVGGNITAKVGGNITAKVLTAEVNFTPEIGSEDRVLICGNMDEFI